MRALARIFWLGLKEIQSLGRDFAMAALLRYAFSLGVCTDATAKVGSVNKVSIAVADEDGSGLSHSFAGGFRPPEFKPAEPIEAEAVDAAMDAGRYIFALWIPPGFESDLAAGRGPELQLQIDATAMEQARLGAGYFQAILSDEIARFAARRNLAPEPAVDSVIRTAFNPTRDLARFQGVMSLIGHISILAIIPWASNLRARGCCSCSAPCSTCSRPPRLGCFWPQSPGRRQSSRSCSSSSSCRRRCCRGPTRRSKAIRTGCSR